MRRTLYALVLLLSVAYLEAPPARGDCAHTDNTVTCQPKLAGVLIAVPITFDTPAARRWDIAPSNRLYHIYERSVPTTHKPKAAGVLVHFRSTPGLAALVRQELVRMPTPAGQQQPATPSGIPNDALPPSMAKWSRALHLTWLVHSPVRSYELYNGAGEAIVFNVTEEGHPLFPGYVLRSVSEQAGEIVVHNIGEGRGFWQSDFNPYRNVINNVWVEHSAELVCRAHGLSQC
jgi:hypothetical protein